jgi:DNA-binding transcriptional LysR family regulator
MRPYTLKQIQTFLEVARQRSVSKAAERLFVTQPAVSMQIRQLEDAFGVPLIEPVGRNIRLTHAGEAFQTYAIAAMGQLKDLEALMAEHVGLKKGRIDLAVVSTAKYFIPMLLVRFGKLFQGIDIQLKIDNRENILGLLARNEADLVVMGRAPGNWTARPPPSPPTRWPSCQRPTTFWCAANSCRLPRWPSTLCGARRRLGHTCGHGAPVCRTPHAFEGGDGNAQQRNHQAGGDGRHGPELFEPAHRAPRTGQRSHCPGGHRRTAVHGALVRDPPEPQETVTGRTRIQGVSD